MIGFVLSAGMIVLQELFNISIRSEEDIAQVCKHPILAGVPDMVINRAKEIVEQLTDNDIIEKVQSIAVDVKNDTKAKKQPKYDEVDLAQMSLFDTVTDEDVLKELEELEISTMTPLDAMNTLYRLQNKLKNRWNG